MDFKGLSYTSERILSALRDYICRSNEYPDLNVHRPTVDEMDKLCTIYTELAGDVRDETGCLDHYPFLLYRVTYVSCPLSLVVCLLR